MTSVFEVPTADHKLLLEQLNLTLRAQSRTWISSRVAPPSSWERPVNAQRVLACVELVHKLIKRPVRPTRVLWLGPAPSTFGVTCSPREKCPICNRSQNPDPRNQAVTSVGVRIPFFRNQ